MVHLIVLLLLFVLQGAFASPLARTPLTPPLLFAGAGALVAALVPAGPAGEEAGTLLLHVAEVGLVLLLFSDGLKTDLGVLRDVRALPTRLLTGGLLLTLLLGVLAALLLFPGLPVWQAGVLAAILAPTDAGLGQVVVSDPRVPMPLRQALSVEAGLNDGVAVPFLLFFVGLAGMQGVGEQASLLRYVFEQLGYGTLLGLGVGFLGGRLLAAARRRAWSVEPWDAIGLLMLPLLCVAASPALGASMFIAAFVAGLAARSRLGADVPHSLGLTESLGQLCNLAVFFLFGTIVPPACSRLEPRHLLYALASLTVVRLLPVALALRGSGLSRAAVLFVGWFGPRGLASIVLALVVLEHEVPVQGLEPVILAVIATVALSILAHGLSAPLGVRLLLRAEGRAAGPGAARTTPPASGAGRLG
jgi:NhaP-type Na+/H+ or K+/H+ antiporter